MPLRDFGSRVGSRSALEPPFLLHEACRPEVTGSARVCPEDADAISGKPRNGLHNPVTPAYKLGLDAALRHNESYQERCLERARLAIGFSGAGPQRRLPPAELLPAVAVVVARRHQGGLPRAGEHRPQFRSRGTQSTAGKA